VPASVENFFLYWCQTQTFCILWAGEYSREFYVNKSVRQGEVLSPYLFNLYMDDLGRLLNSSGVGCRIGSTISNYIWYADDLCLLAPSICALQRLINISCNYVLEHNITFNSKNTVCMVLDFNYSKNSCLESPAVCLSGALLKWVDSFNYLGICIASGKRHYDTEEIEKRPRELRIRANMIASRFHHATSDMKKLIFTTYFSQIYCMGL